jgi:hypothetical protein
VVSFALGAPAGAEDADPASNGAGAAASARATLPGSLADDPMLDAWLRIDATGRVTVFTGKA